MRAAWGRAHFPFLGALQALRDWPALDAVSLSHRNLAFAGLLALACLAARARGGWWESLGPRDLEDSPVALKTRWVAVVFVSVDCPLANASIPGLNALARLHPEVTFLAAYEDCDATAGQLRAHAREFQLGFGALDDRSQRLSARAKADYTPEVAVFTATGELEYLGRIDDKQSGVGESRPSATEHDLADVLAALAAGKPGPFAFHPGFGCALPRKVTR